MNLIFARHGNTFGPDDTPVWVGAREDYPLVERGKEQAHELADALLRSNYKPDVIIAGPLLRTRLGAEIVADRTELDSQIVIDERLKEIDYGSWGGKSDLEIERLYGEHVIPDWRERSLRPEMADWEPSENTIRMNAENVLTEIRQTYGNASNVLLISSNGTLRYFHSILYKNVDNAPSAKVKTGHMCLALRTCDDFEPKFWNLNPADL